MLENLINIVREHAGEAIVNNPDIPNEHNDAAISEATQGIASALKSQLAGGGIQEITSLFNSGGSFASNPIIGNIIHSVAGSLMQKFGISAAQAGGVANSLIPKVMGSLVSKTNDPNDSSFTLDGILSSLTSSNSGIGNMLGGLFGGK